MNGIEEKRPFLIGVAGGTASGKVIVGFFYGNQLNFNLCFSRLFVKKLWKGWEKSTASTRNARS